MANDYYAISIKCKSISKLEYVFEIETASCEYSDLQNQMIGTVSIKIDLDNNFNRYCGEMDFNFVRKFNRRYSGLMPNLISLLSCVFTKNGFGNRFLITNDKENKIIQNECEAEDIYYFIIKRAINNKVFYENQIDEVFSKGNLL
jgi:hypothetical protein